MGRKTVLTISKLLRQDPKHKKKTTLNSFKGTLINTLNVYMRLRQVIFHISKLHDYTRSLEVIIIKITQFADKPPLQQ